MDSIVLLGDSLFQRAFTQDKDETGQIIGSLGPRLSDAYMRKLDIINRGFSGYNTTQVLRLLRTRRNILPKRRNSESLIIIFLGANDARLPDTSGGPQQHVPWATFRSNLRDVVSALQAVGFARIVLITTPPVDERQTVIADSEKDRTLKDVIRRKATVTADYAQAVRDVGREKRLPVLDLWTTLMEKAGYSKSSSKSPAADELDTEYLDEYGNTLTESKISTSAHDERLLPGSSTAPKNSVLQSYFVDGLHFSRKGYDLLFDELMKIIRKEVPALAPEALGFAVPAWDDVEKWRGNVPEGPQLPSWDTGSEEFAGGAMVGIVGTAFWGLLGLWYWGWLG